MSDDSPKSLFSISLNDVFGVGRGFEALLRTLQAGVGTALEPLVRNRLARSDQNSVRGWLEVANEASVAVTTLDVATLAGRADIRLSSERERKQVAREAIALGALREADFLIEDGAIPKDVTVEPEWLHRFWRLAEDITSEQLQSLWARIAARQSIGLANISPRTLEALSLLTASEMNQLTRLAPLVCRSSEPAAEAGTHNAVVLNELIKAEVTFEDMRNLRSRVERALQAIGADPLHFQAIGLIAGRYNFELPLPPDGVLSIGGGLVTVSPDDLFIGGHPRPRVLGVGYGLTPMGEEIIGLIRTVPDPAYIQDIITAAEELLYIQLARA
jgi:hypothetical protein